MCPEQPQGAQLTAASELMMADENEPRLPAGAFSGALEESGAEAGALHTSWEKERLFCEAPSNSFLDRLDAFSGAIDTKNTAVLLFLQQLFESGPSILFLESGPE